MGSSPPRTLRWWWWLGASRHTQSDGPRSMLITDLSHTADDLAHGKFGLERAGKNSYWSRHKGRLSLPSKHIPPGMKLQPRRSCPSPTCTRWWAMSMRRKSSSENSSDDPSLYQQVFPHQHPQLLVHLADELFLHLYLPLVSSLWVLIWVPNWGSSRLTILLSIQGGEVLEQLELKMMKV